jgi:phosphatidylserine decarboxylase
MVRDGYIYGMSLLAVAAMLAWVTGVWAWAIVPLLLALFFLWFFRDPDGLVTEATSISTPEGPRKRISIFLSVFDVHVNRAPIAGELRQVRYHKGQYLNAMNPKSAESNERNVVTMYGEGIEITFKQIAGLLARRIVFPFKEGDRVERGQRVGLIKFGSRTDIVMPVEAEFQVKVGERVKGGASVLAVMMAGAGATTNPHLTRAASASVFPDPKDEDRQ